VLISLQKKMDAAHCPSCGKKEVLQASIICDHDEKTYEPVAHCRECGLSLIVKLPDNFRRDTPHHQMSMTCDLETAACNFEVEDAQQEAA
jgi:uncharacterized Zn finger protein